MSTSAPSPSVLLRRAITAKAPMSLRDAQDAEVASLALASKIQLGDQLIEKIGAFEAVSPSSHPSTINLPILWLVWVTKSSSVGDYLKEARGNGVAFVPIERRKAIIDWLGGEGPERADAPAPGASSAPLPSGAASSSTAPSSSATQKRKYIPDPADLTAVAKIQAVEILLLDRNTPLRSTSLTTSGSGKESKKDFTAMRRSLFSDKLRGIQSGYAAMTGSGKSAQPVASGSSGGLPLGAMKPRNMTPIIVVSSSPTSLITMWNIKRFLEEGVFESTKDARESLAARGQFSVDNFMTVTRRMGTEGRKYVVVEGFEGLLKISQNRPDDVWPRVCCVLTTGQTWQFKNFKWEDPKTLFHHVKGVYFHWAKTQPVPAIRDWNVTALEIDPSKRHVDRALAQQFWRTVDQFRPTGGAAGR